jgi:hypothetical protein
MSEVEEQPAPIYRVSDEPELGEAKSRLGGNRSRKSEVLKKQRAKGSGQSLVYNCQVPVDVAIIIYVADYKLIKDG